MPIYQSILDQLNDSIYYNGFTGSMENSVAPGQLASSEASWPGATLF